jgi:hypothetical protein
MKRITGISFLLILIVSCTTSDETIEPLTLQDSIAIGF